ncbi:MAG: hypothetical protein V4710_04990, partial [Verrucomicrobiota bacterium]
GGVANFWNKDADGSWITGGNWSEGAAPNGVSAFANFGGGGVLLSGPRTVTLGTVQTVGSIGFNSAQPYTLTGTGSLLLNNGIDPVTQITNTNGSHVIG